MDLTITYNWPKYRFLAKCMFFLFDYPKTSVFGIFFCHDVNTMMSSLLMQVFWSNMWLGFSVCVSRLSAHDLPQKAGVTALAICPLP